MLFRLVALNCRYTHSCLALYYLRAALEKNLFGHVRVLIEERTINDSYYETLLCLVSEPCDGLFFSVALWNEGYVSRLVEDIRAILPDLPIVVGGPQITHGAEQPFHRFVTLVKGEAEGLPPAFFTDLAAKNLQREYRAQTEASFPYPYREEDLSTTLANRSIYYEASRGCPFSCTYCLSSIDRKMRVKAVEEVEKELERLLAARPKTVRFVDRTFNVDPERTLRLWRFLAEKGGQTVFHFEIAPDRFNDTMLSFLATVQPGRFRFEIGLQTITPQALATVRRSMDWDKAAAAIGALTSMDTVHLHVDLILGLPNETEESYFASFNKVFLLQPHYIQMGLLKILPGTAMAAEKENYGMVCCRQPPYELLASRWMDRKTLARLYLFGEAVEAVCNNRFFRAFLAWMRRRRQDPSTAFLDIMAIFEEKEFRGLARTQELISRVLCRYAAGQPEREVLLDLLRYDWLRSGHRFLPPSLGQDQGNLRQEVSRRLPQNLSPYFTYRQRDEFIKRAMFLALCPEAIEELGFSGLPAGCLCILPEKESGVFGLQKTTWLPFA